MDSLEIEFHRKILSIAYRIDELKEQELFIDWKKIRSMSLAFSEIRMNYFELRDFLFYYLDKSNDYHLRHVLLLSRFQKIFTQRISNFLFSTDKFYDYYNGSNLQNKYYKMDKHADGIRSFFLHIRNFVGHKAQFPAIAILNFEKNKIYRFESFSKKEILEYLNNQISEKNMNKNRSLFYAKSFINSLDEKPNILKLIDDYYSLIQDELFKIYYFFFKARKDEFESFFQENSHIVKENERLKVMGLVPPLRDSEIRLIKYLIKKSQS